MQMSLRQNLKNWELIMNRFKMRVKKRLTDELARIKSFSSDFYKGEQEGINFALYAIDSIDGPEKPVVPQFVVDYIEENRDALEEYVFTNVSVTLPVIPADDPMYKWLNNKGIGVIVDCIRNGYEVEKRKVV